jgi:FkbM family methyltransferase
MSYLKYLQKKIKSILGVNQKGIESPTYVAARKKMYSQFFSGAGDLYFDVGANMGNRIEPLIDMGLKIVAVEPQKKCFEYLQKKYEGKITVVPKGLGEKEEVLDMFIANTSTISSFSREWIESTKQSGRFSRNNWNETVQIEITTLDNVIAEHGLPKFIKIDVEGFELHVLKGLSQPVEYISYEYVMPERKQAVIDCLNRILEIAGEKKVVFNYSVGESMDFYFAEWVDQQVIRKEIESNRFSKSSFGDLYAKTYL